ncbi:MAG TPA: hypothetical protein ENO19_05610, partial [Halothiobacillaceae bacterium]|nr:hypothetical protein [Halothiobacillaceae bacterium]
MEVGDGLQEIRNRKLIVVEGKDDVGFFRVLLDSMNIADFLVCSVGGKGNFGKSLRALSVVRGFNELTHLAVVRDRDDDRAFESVAGILGSVRLKGSLGDVNLQVPLHENEFAAGHPSVGIFILPGRSIEGSSLEDMCLATVCDRKEMACVRGFADCMASLRGRPMRSKSKVLAYLAAQSEPVNTIGLGAARGY